MTGNSAGDVLRSVLHVSGAHVLNGVLGLVFVPVALAVLGEVGYGALSVYWFALGYLALAELGVGKNLLREAAAASPEQRRQHLQRALSAYMLVAAGVLALTPLLAWVVPRWIIPFPAEMHGVVAALVVVAVVEYLLGIAVSLHLNNAMASGRFREYAAFQSISGGLRWGGGLTALLLLPSGGPAVVAVAFAARRFVEIPLAMRMLGRLPAGTWSTWSPTWRVGGILARSSTLSIAQLLQTSVVSAGSVLIGHTGGPAALGLFRACFDLASKLWFISNAFGLVLFPRFAHLQASATGRQRLARVLPGALSLSATALTIIGVAGVFMSAPLLALIGLEGGMAWSIFALALAGVALHAHGGVPYELVQANGRFGAAAGIAGVALAALLVSFAVLNAAAVIPLLALGWAWLISQAFYAFLCRQAAGHMLLGTTTRFLAIPIDEVLSAVTLAAACASVVAVTSQGRAVAASACFVLLFLMIRRLLPVWPVLWAGVRA